MNKTEIQRVQSATQQQIEDFSTRLKNIDKYALPTGANPEQVTVPCFCCDKEVTHTDNGGDGFWAEANTENREFRTVMMHLECEDHPLIWRESDGGWSYTIVIGESGPHGLTPETTKYSDSDE